MTLLVGPMSAGFYGVGSKVASAMKSRMLFFDLD
jgi:shikimate kinase